MFTIKDVQVITCEAKEWEMEGKKGIWYATCIRVGVELFNMSSKVQLEQDKNYDLEFEFQVKNPKKGMPYTGVRIVSVVE